MSRLSIVIVNWNGASLLTDCLAPLEGTEFEVIVVDNGSTDESLALLAGSFPSTRVIANPDNRGFAAASNQGLRQSAGDAVLFLNNDTIPSARGLSELAGFLARHPDVGVAGPSLVFPDGTRQPSCGPGPALWTELLSKTLLHRILPGLRTKAPTASCPVDWVTGAALAIRRDLALQLGGFDEEMFMFYEDLDLCARVREAGRSVWFVATDPTVHVGGASRRRVESESLIHSFDSADRFFARHGPSWRRQLLRALTVPEMGLRIGVWAALAVSPKERDIAVERIRAYRTILGRVSRPAPVGPGEGPTPP